MNCLSGVFIVDNKAANSLYDRVCEKPSAQSIYITYMCICRADNLFCVWLDCSAKIARPFYHYKEGKAIPNP